MLIDQEMPVGMNGCLRQQRPFTRLLAGLIDFNFLRQTSKGLPVTRFNGSGRSPPLLAPPSRRARFDALGESPREMALINETRVQRDLAQRLIGIENELLRPLNAFVKQPLMWRATDCLLECSAKMAGRQATGTRQLPQTEIARQVCAQHFLCPPLLPGRQASPTVFRPKLNGTVGPGVRAKAFQLQ
jgi:hypothetical protein